MSFHTNIGEDIVPRSLHRKHTNVIFGDDNKKYLYTSEHNFCYILQNIHSTNTISVADLNMRTTSSVESLNAKLGRVLPKRSNIFRFLACLKIFEFEKVDGMRSLVSCIPPKQMKRKRTVDKTREKKIEYFSDLLSKKKITVNKFMDIMADSGTLPPDGKKHLFEQRFLYFLFTKN